MSEERAERDAKRRDQGAARVRAQVAKLGVRGGELGEGRGVAQDGGPLASGDDGEGQPALDGVAGEGHAAAPRAPSGLPEEDVRRLRAPEGAPEGEREGAAVFGERPEPTHLPGVEGNVANGAGLDGDEEEPRVRADGARFKHGRGMGSPRARRARGGRP